MARPYKYYFFGEHLKIEQTIIHSGAVVLSIEDELIFMFYGVYAQRDIINECL